MSMFVIKINYFLLNTTLTLSNPLTNLIIIYTHIPVFRFYIFFSLDTTLFKKTSKHVHPMLQMAIHLPFTR